MFKKLFLITLIFSFLFNFSYSNIVNNLSKKYFLRYNLKKGEVFIYNVKTQQNINIGGQLQPFVRDYQLKLLVEDKLKNGNYILSYFLLPQGKLLSRNEVKPNAEIVDAKIQGGKDNSVNISFPTEKVGVGDSWPVYAQSFNQGIEIKTQGKATFEKVIVYKGRKCAVIKMNFIVKGSSNKVPSMNVSGSGTSLSYVDLQKGYNLYSFMKMKMNFNVNGQEYTADSKMEMTLK